MNKKFSQACFGIEIVFDDSHLGVAFFFGFLIALVFVCFDFFYLIVYSDSVGNSSSTWHFDFLIGFFYFIWTFLFLFGFSI